MTLQPASLEPSIFESPSENWRGATAGGFGFGRGGAGGASRNGCEFYASEADAAGEMSEAEFAAWLKANSRRAKH